MNVSTGRDRMNSPLRLESRYGVLIDAIAVMAAATGVLVVTGWMLGIESLVRLRPDLNVMKFNTALCLVASGCGLWLAAHATATSRTIAARALGTFVLVIGAMSWLEQCLGWNLHIDRLFWNDLRWEQDTLRMVPPTAAFFVFAGSFLLVSTAKQRRVARLGPLAALLSNLAAQVAVLNLIFLTDKTNAAAGHTAGALLALSIAMLLFPSKLGMFSPLVKMTAGGRIIRRLVPAATLMPLLTGWIYLEATRTGILTSAAGIVSMVILYSASLVLITVWTANSIDNVDLRLAAIIDSSENAILSKSLEGVILTWNNGAESLYGYPAAEAIGKSVWMLIPPEYHQEQQEFLDQVRRGASISHHETVRVRKDGSRFDASVTLSPVRNARDEVIGCSAIARDITERKRAEAEILALNKELERRVAERTVQLMESERHVRKKLDNILTPEGDITSLELRDIIDVDVIQPLMEDLWKLTSIRVAIIDLGGKMLIGAGWQDICTEFHSVHPESRKHCFESDCQLTTRVRAGEFKLYRCKNNMWDVVTPIMLGDRHIGNLISGQFLFEDQTVDEDLFRAQARKYDFDESSYLAALGRVPRISRARMTAAMEMYSRLAGVLSKLGYSSVKLARTMAETKRANDELIHSSKELEGFAYSVSHDLRAPLRHLNGFLTLLSKRSYDSLDVRGKHYIDCTMEASLRMGRLIDDLLQFSRLGRSEIHKGQVDLSGMIREVRKELAAEARGRKIVWRIRNLPPVYADKAMLRQVLENLISNALKFTGKRAAAEISIGAKPAQDGTLSFFVKDNGAGFDMRYYDKLFQVFQRLHGEEEFEGTGIGLANVRRIVERHGGAVWAEGEVGMGATFYFSLPQEDIRSGVTDEHLETNLAG
jgi:PAS domain S-box-containing protein